MIGREPIKKISRALDENQLKKSQFLLSIKMQSKVMLLRNREKENALAKPRERERSYEIVSKVMLLQNRETENSHQKNLTSPFIL